jgi:hypothetical protein
MRSCYNKDLEEEKKNQNLETIEIEETDQVKNL